ncbi:MAG: hypothetical protein KJ638_15375 [Chloroflexi bacterium]|nr:hypothetical protein [Chloroflexota bacterium]
MKLRKYSLLLLAIVLLFALSVSAEASVQYQEPGTQPDPQESLIKKVLEETAADLGWEKTVGGPSSLGCTGGLLGIEATCYDGVTYGISFSERANQAIESPDDDIFGVLISRDNNFGVSVIAFPTSSGAKDYNQDYIRGRCSAEIPDCHPTSIHGFPGATQSHNNGDSAGGDSTWSDFTTQLQYQSGRFVFSVYGHSNFDPMLDRVRSIDSVFYGNAVDNGLIGGDNVDIVTITETVSPIITETPKLGAPIVLKASRDGYGEASQTISNAQNYEVVIVAGQVTDQEGNGVSGANVEVISGANPAAISTNADGTYSLVLNISGGQGNGSVGGINFSLQLEGDLSIAKIELVQAVSGAELADSKHTAALVFPRFSSQAQSSVDSKVTLYVNGQFFKTLPFRVKNNYGADEHRKIHDALKFFIPPSFVRTGVFEVRAVIDPENAFVEPDEANNEKTWSQMVSPSRGLSIVMVALSPNVRSEAAQAWASTARRFLANTYPVPAVRIVQHPVYSNGWLNLAMALRDAAIVNNARVAYNAANPTSRVEYTVGLYPPNAYGAGNRGFVYRYLYPQAPLVSLDFPITIAHEIGHIYLGGHEEVDDDPNLGGVSLPEGYMYDYITGQVRYIKPNSNWINFMGDPYAGYELGGVTVRPWVSPTAFNTILRVRQTAADSQPKRAALAVPSWSATAPFEQVLYLSGYFDYGELNVLPPQTLNTIEVGNYPVGEYMATMEAADGSTLANVSFGMNDDLGEYDAPNPGAFQVEIPYPANAVRLVITKDGQEFYRLEKSAHAPTVSVVQPGSGSPVNGETSVTWSAMDGDSEVLTYNVYYSPDDGASWQLLGVGWTDPNLPIDGSLLPGSDAALIRVVASDGLNTGQADSPPFVVPKHTPSITVLPPDPEAEPWVVGHPNLLAATAEDIEDGWLPFESIQWASDKDGIIGQGNAVYAALSAGEHTITVTATDSDGQQASDTTTIAVSGVDGATAFNFPANTLYLVGGGACLLFLAGIILAGVFVFSRRKGRPQSAIAPARDQFQRVQDSQGRWWYQDPKSGAWSVWNGRSWQLATTPQPPVKSPPRAPKQRSSGSCLFSLIAVFVLAALIVGGISLVAFNFLPGYQIQRGPGDLTEILKMGGGGALVSILGLLLLNGGFKAIITRRAIVEDDWGRRREKRGCSAILNGLGQLFFGILLLAGGLGMMAMTFYQEVLPWLGVS